MPVQVKTVQQCLCCRSSLYRYNAAGTWTWPLICI